jgi:hypothetical protein
MATVAKAAPPISAHPPVPPVAMPVAPLAQPVAAPSASSHANPSPFASFEDSSVPGYRRRRSRGGRWIGPLVCLFLIGVAGIIVAVNWAQIKRLIAEQAAEAKVADNKETDDTSKTEAPKKLDIPVKPRSGDGDTPTKKSDETPKKTEPKKTDEPNKTDEPKKTEPKRAQLDLPKVASQFPRRALLISVNDYLYMNPINYGAPGHGFDELRVRLVNNLKFPMTQITELSDAARVSPHSPVKPVIEQVVTEFLAASRLQDHIIVLFAGHALEIGDEVFLVPIEGETDQKETLIPLAWLYQQLADCKAQQKVLVMDVCRFNPAQGVERPGSGPMGKKLAEMTRKPPDGVQVWTTCSEEQFSYEDSYNSNSFFHEKLMDVLSVLGKGTIQKPEDPLPLESLVEAVNKGLEAEMGRRGKKQVTHLSGKTAAESVAYDPKEALPAKMEIKSGAGATAAGAATKAQVRVLLEEIAVPPVKRTTGHGSGLTAESMPPFASKTLDAYPPFPGESPLKTAVQNARAVLREINDAKDNLPDSFIAPVNEQNFKNDVLGRQQKVANLVSKLETVLEEMDEVAKDKKSDPSKRWQAHFDYLRARVMMQIAYIYEYTSLLGQMRKELPARDPNLHNGWRMASQEKLNGDKAGKDRAKAATKILEKLATDHAGTPWEVLSKRERLTTLGLEWQAARIGGEP